VLIRYTAMGDSDLSGTVDLTDFTLLAANFGATSGKSWFNGDYDYNGAVDLTDFTYLASNFNYTVPSAADAIGAPIPEPRPVAAAVLVFCIILQSRRRHLA
jgi:hypothetical protein